MSENNVNAWVESQFADNEADPRPATPASDAAPDDGPRNAGRGAAPPRTSASVRQTIAELMRGGKPAMPPPATAPPATVSAADNPMPEPPAPEAEAEADEEAADEAVAAPLPVEAPEAPSAQEATGPEPEPQAPMPEPEEAPALAREDAAAEPPAMGGGGLPDLERYFPWLRDRRPPEPEADEVAIEAPLADESVAAGPVAVAASAPPLAADEAVTAPPEPEPEPAPAPEPEPAPEPTRSETRMPAPARSTIRPAPTRSSVRPRSVAPPLSASEFWALRPRSIEQFVAAGSPRATEAVQACRDRLDQVRRMLGGGAVSPSERASAGSGRQAPTSACRVQPPADDGSATLRSALEFVNGSGRRSDA